MNRDELIEILRQFDEKRVEELPEKTRNIFYAIMKIADERDELKNIINEAIEFILDGRYGEDDDLESISLYMPDLLNILNKGDKNE